MIYSKNAYLSPEEMTANATYILNYFTAAGWTKNAVCGMLGNMQTESTINPGIWESFDAGNMSRGYGLVQWTPATKFIDWCNDRGLNYTDMDSDLKRITYEVENNIQWYNDSLGNPPPFTFTEFTKSTLSAYDLGMIFLHHYEIPHVYDQPDRGTQAEHWFNTLDGSSSDPGTDPGGKGYLYHPNFKFYFYKKGRKRIV
jgi:hypothetical protein